ncbi:MAG TPA: hypothetical protein VK108_06640 [Pseudogracilibacillus sp.]|nr:hypothetical protein [Pseudogracilibacillus sp.]
MNVQRVLRRILRIGLDAKAIKNGNINQRVGRRFARKAIRKSTRKLFK